MNHILKVIDAAKKKWMKVNWVRTPVRPALGTRNTDSSTALPFALRDPDCPIVHPVLPFARAGVKNMKKLLEFLNANPITHDDLDDNEKKMYKFLVQNNFHALTGGGHPTVIFWFCKWNTNQDMIKYNIDLKGKEWLIPYLHDLDGKVESDENLETIKFMLEGFRQYVGN